MNIDIKNLEFIDKKLRDICVFLEDETGLKFTITSIYRIGDTGVHGMLPVRGLDLRVWCEDVGLSVEKLVNDNFLYDPSRPQYDCALYHDSGKGAHIHLQVHHKTIKA